jgi:hypothetical protein
MAETLLRQKCETVIASGSRFLKEQLRAGNCKLSCHGNDGAARFSHDKGHLFAGCFVAEALANDLDEVERSLLLVRLLTEEAEGRWGYSPRAYAPGLGQDPHLVDADDTAFALRTFRRLGVYRSPKPLLHFFRSRRLWSRGGWKREEGFVTFATGRRASLACEPAHEQNFDIHPEVNANVFLALMDSDEQHYIRSKIVQRSQAKDGSWHSFFYPSKFYATNLFMALIERLGGFEEQEKRALRFLMDSQNPDGSWGNPGNPYETALALKALGSRTGMRETAAPGLAFLVGTQRADGSWCYEDDVWEFQAGKADVWRSRDTNRVITTSLCVDALRSSRTGEA